MRRRDAPSVTPILAQLLKSAMSRTKIGLFWPQIRYFLELRLVFTSLISRRHFLARLGLPAWLVAELRSVTHIASSGEHRGLNPPNSTTSVNIEERHFPLAFIYFRLPSLPLLVVCITTCVATYTNNAKACRAASPVDRKSVV